MKNSKLQKIALVFTSALMLSMSASAHEYENHYDRDMAHHNDRNHHEEQSGCRFVGSSCYGIYQDSLWVETINFTDPKGNPTEFDSGKQLFKIDQRTNQYYGYKLKRVSFIVSKHSFFSEAKLALYVNGAEKGKEEVKGTGSIFSSNEPRPISIEVNDCPIDLLAIVSSGSVHLYSISFYWEAVDGSFAPPVNGGMNNIGLVVNNLETNLKRMLSVIAPETYAVTISPLLAETKNLKTKLATCGVPCSAEAAQKLIQVKAQHEAELNEIGSVAVAERFVEYIEIAVARIQEYYRVTPQPETTTEQ